MPPKKKKGGGGKAKVTKEKVKKHVEDKTFGMKNKNKSKKAQKFIAMVEKEAMTGGKSHRRVQLEEQARLAKSRKQLKKEKDEANQMLFKKVVSAPKQQMAAGADPKSVLCAFFKAGQCKHGKKCKFSHDLSLDRKAAKMNVYADPRANDTMDSWDQAKLEEVVKTKEGQLPPTTIICKYFIKAIEDKKYGWLWSCPNGSTCHYRHALPPGYVLKRDEKKDDGEEEDEEETLMEQIEKERRALDSSKLTPMTEELFLKWKVEEEARRVKEVEQKVKEVKQKKKAKGGNAQLSGRDLFTYDPTLFVDDDEAADDDTYVIREDFAESEEAKAAAASAAKNEAAARGDVANVQDAGLFLDDEVELPSDDDEDDEE